MSGIRSEEHFAGSGIDSTSAWHFEPMFIDLKAFDFRIERSKYNDLATGWTGSSVRALAVSGYQSMKALLRRRRMNYFRLFAAQCQNRHMIVHVFDESDFSCRRGKNSNLTRPGSCRS